MRLIDGNKLLDCLPDDLPYKGAVKRVLMQAPEAVVRCRDCVYFEKAQWNNRGYLICPASGMEITNNDFCSYGKRKEHK